MLFFLAIKALVLMLNRTQLWLKAVGETLDDLPTRAYLLEVGQECCCRELADQQRVSKQCIEPVVQQLDIYNYPLHPGNRI